MGRSSMGLNGRGGRGLGAALVLWPALVLAPAAPPPAPCDMATLACNAWDAKVPPVSASPVAQMSIETDLDGPSKRRFEHALGQGLRSTTAVQFVTQELGQRLLKAVVGADAAADQMRKALRDETLRKAFAPAHFGKKNTGYAGSDAADIESALGGGQIREVWAYAYALTETRWLDDDVAKNLAAPSGPAALHSRGLDVAALRERLRLVNETLKLPASRQSDQGIQHLGSPGFESWVRFDTDASKGDGTLLWHACRVHNTACPETFGESGPGLSGCIDSRRSDDPTIVPRLSDAELKYQCDGAASCTLAWQPADKTFDLCTDSTCKFGDVNSGEVPGFAARAELLGYRTVSGPSDVAQNLLQYATYLGFSADWLPLLRLALLAWMLPTDDNSLWEIMLGAEPYIAPLSDGGRFTLSEQSPLDDLTALCPRDLQLASAAVLSAAPLSKVACADVWSSVRAHMPRNVTALFNARQRAEWLKLTSPSPPAGAAPAPDDDDGCGWGCLLKVVVAGVGAAALWVLWKKCTQKRQLENWQAAAAILAESNSAPGRDTLAAAAPGSSGKSGELGQSLLAGGF